MMKSLSTHITESFVNESSKVGLTFKYNGQTHTIKKIDGDFLKTTEGKEFKISTISKNGFIMPEPEPKVKAKKIPSNPLMSPSKYQSLCKNAAKSGGGENAADLADSMITDPEIYARLQKDYPQLVKQQLKQRLQWDIEAYS